MWVVTTDFATEISRFSTKATKFPTEFVWCGSDAIVCHWKTDEQVEFITTSSTSSASSSSSPASSISHVLLFVGPLGQSFYYRQSDSGCFLVGECDGLRIVSQAGTDIVNKVASKSIYYLLLL